MTTLLPESDCCMPPTRPLVLRNAFVFDSEERRFAPGMDVLVRDGTIASIGPGIAAPDDAETVALDGAYVIPGLIDCHVHLTSSGAPEALTRSQADHPHMRAFRATRHAEATLAAGFTTVRDLGAPEHLNVHLARAVDEGVVAGPRILAAGMGRGPAGARRPLWAAGAWIGGRLRCARSGPIGRPGCAHETRALRGHL